MIKLQCNPGAATKSFDLVPEILNSSNIQMISATTREVENHLFQANLTKIYVAFSDELHEKQLNLELKDGEEFLQYRHIITVDVQKTVAISEMTDGRTFRSKTSNSIQK